MKPKRSSEDIPKVGLDIVLKSAEIAERERTVTISTYFVCHLTVIDIKQIQILLHFKYIYILATLTTTVTLSPEY